MTRITHERKIFGAPATSAVSKHLSYGVHQFGAPISDERMEETDMRSGTIGLVILGTLAGSAAALSQPIPPASPTRVPSATAPAVTESRSSAARSVIVDAATLEAGSNSFTEGQAKSRLEDAGFTGIQGLTKDASGFWRARGTRNGSVMDIAMDFQGRIAAGPGVATLPSGSARAVTPVSPSTTTSTGPTPARDGTPGNPPSTMTGRAVDRLQGETPRADGTPGNPPGTAVGRTVDRATGSPPVTGPATPSR